MPNNYMCVNPRALKWLHLKVWKGECLKKEGKLYSYFYICLKFLVINYMAFIQKIGEVLLSQKDPHFSNIVLFFLNKNAYVSNNKNMLRNQLSDA